MNLYEANLKNELDFLGAVASNAGDDFHILWATREMLRLLDDDGDITAVKVEGPPQDETHATLGEHGQAADVTLIRGSGGEAVYRYLQLKHSASNPSESWSWSRLLRRRAKTKPLSSVLGKLAGLMKAVQFRGDFAIVTNQPLSATVAKDVTRLITNEAKPSSEDRELLSKLTKGLGLTRPQVVIFLKAWDLTGFASASRLVMESEVIQRLASIADADARDDANLLQKRVATLMLPESRNDPAVTREVLSVWLGAGSRGMLFPAPSQIEPAQPYMRRAVIDCLGEKLAAPQLKPLRVHAGGGCGKTSLIWDLPSVLPAGSETFVYDCYGGGLFLASDQKRHLPEQAFTQLGNELAARLRTPLVLRRRGSIDVLEAFRNRVIVAADLIKLRGADAKLVLCFDAVDNARAGARHWHEPCFLDMLTRVSTWPENVRILVSCRTARRDEVGDKHLFEDFPVPNFDVDEVRKLVALWQPEWRPELAETFENLTGGNPRRLVYAIKGLPSNGEAQAIMRLMPKAEGINPLFEQRVGEAGKHLGDPDKVWHVLDALSRLPRPVPGDVLADLAGLTPADIGDIATDVGGIIERKEGWSFHDEDFEAFVIERPGNDSQALLTRAADLLLETRLTNRYAATSVAEVLAAANRLEALYSLVTKDDGPSAVLTPLETEFVWSRRLSLAIRCCRTAADITNACSLLIASAEAIRRTNLLESLTVGNLDLSVRFAAEEANRLVMVGQIYKAKRPRLRIELARMAAPTLPETAKMHLRWWHAHIDELRQADSPNGFKVSARDIASEYETYSALFGEKEAFARLFDWRPKAVLQPVFEVLAARAAGRSCHALLQAIDARMWPPVALAPLMAAALLSGADIGSLVLRRGVARLANATRARWSKAVETGLSHSPLLAWQEAVLLVCERAIAHDDLKPLVAQILDRAIPKPEFSEAHHLYRLCSAGARHARAYALRELISGVTVPVAEWLPPRREEPPRNDRRSARHQEKSPEQYWNESLAETLSAFSRFVKAARITLASLAKDPLAAWEALAKALDVSRAYNQSSRRNPDAATLLLRNHIVHIAIVGSNVTSLLPSMRKILQGWSADDITRVQDLAASLALMPTTHDTVLTLLTEIQAEIEAAPLPASERVKLFGECARIALPLDPELAEWLFGEAVGATSSVDFEAHSALAAAGGIAKTGLGGLPAEHAVFAARLGDAAGAVVESLALGSDFAWDEVVGWVTAANLPMGLVSASRWSDWGIIPLSRSLPKVIAVAGNELSLAQRTALATLASDGPIDIDVAFGDDTRLPNWIVRPALEESLREGDIDSFLTAFDKLESLADVDADVALADVRGQRDVLHGWLESYREDQCSYDEDEPKEQDSVVLSTRDEVRRVLEAAFQNRKASAHQLRQIAERLGSITLRVPFLDIALEFGGDDGGLGKAIPEILNSWSIYPPVTSWMRERFASYIVGALRHLFSWNYDDTEVLEAALAATGLSPLAQADILLEGIERQGERISADLLYTLTGLIAARTPAKDRAGLMDALLSRVEARTSHPSLICLASVSPPQDVAECIARTLFAAMGDMDRRIRWRACHAALVLLHGRDPAWEKLVARLTKDQETVFAGAHFYRYAALEQLMIVLQRAAQKNVQAIESHTATIFETIRREPHVIVRELGRTILLAIDAAGLGRLTEIDRTFVQQLNRSQLSSTAANKESPRQAHDDEDSRKRNYSFDRTDAIPYWYAPAAQLFDMRMDTFLDRVEHWLHDKWNYDHTTTHWVQEPRLHRLKDAHEMTSRRHGARPTIERLSYYIEWHAMMCVVGELIVEKPIAAELEDNALSTWLEESLPTLMPHWLSDLRSPPPMEPRFWGFAPDEASKQQLALADRVAASFAWGHNLLPDVFDTEVTAFDDVVVAADYTICWRDALQHVTIHSALVSPETAHSLAQALANTRDRMDFALPEGHYYHEIRVDGFQLETWLVTREFASRGDKFDERRGTVSGIPVKPVGNAELENLSFDPTRGAWETHEAEEVIRIAQWGSDDASNGYGWRATASRALLIRQLERLARSLIILVEISRQIRDDEVDKNKRQWMLYVLDSRGLLTRVARERRSFGRVLVRREGLDKSVDTLGRWMLHQAAEVYKKSKTASVEEVLALDSEIAKLCDTFKRRDRNNF